MDENRLARVRDNLARRGLEQTLIVDPLSIWWLCGYYTEPYERFLALLLPAEGAPALFANRLFPDASGCGARVVEFSDTDDPVALVAAETDRARPLGVDKELAARWLVPLMEAGAASSFVLASDAVDDARSIKDVREQELMRAASAVNDQAMSWLVDQVRPGVTERQIADGLLGEYRRLGAEGHSFSPIVSFGANAADPHHEPDDTPFSRGDMVLFDDLAEFRPRLVVTGGQVFEPEADLPVKPDPNAAPFTTADASYFADALFIGDSRTVGLKEYGQIEGADFFCTTGMNVYKVRDEVVNVGSVGSVTLDQLLSAKTYGKIYLMLGINETGWVYDSIFIEKYGEIIGTVTSLIESISHSYEYPNYPPQIYWPFGRLSVDFSKSVYDWDNMIDDYVQGEYTDEQGSAVAKLMYDCGVSVDMMYSTSASGAADQTVATALSTYFGYNCKFYYRDAYMSDEFFKLIATELDAKRPVLFAGTGEAGGHEFVIDGYDTNRFLHVNWGWNGLDDGYYDVTFCNAPSQDNDGYYRNHSMLVGLRPRTDADTGCVLVYRTEDLEHFSLANTLATDEKFGYMWECPDLAELGGRGFLLCCPQGIAHEEHRYQNEHQCGYFALEGDVASDARVGARSVCQRRIRHDDEPPGRQLGADRGRRV